MRTPSIRTQDFLYDLPAAKIAQHPLADRSASKLLVADLPRRTIADHRFAELPDLLPRESLIVMNDSRVMPARLPVVKATGGAAEIFLLEPLEPTPNPTLALEKGSPAVWNCLIGGKRIGEGDELQTADGKIRARILSKERNDARVALEWTPAAESLASVLEHAGKLPLPPYMKREVQREDLERYQTVYAQAAGSVAAPTAGLHFTPEVLAALDERQVRTARLTLHVGAGTFKPVEAETVAGHAMHRERFEVTPEFLEAVASQLDPKPHRAPLVAVGTTSLRTLESLYWMGALWLEGHEPTHLDQWTPYSLIEAGVHDRVRPSEAFRAVAEYIERRKLRRLVATTSLMIVPGYNFRSADILLTNFHQPGSSLILLVAAWMGERWREVYDHALANDYRFLSYGDSSLLVR
jgi:S-adenosylmethionine:tRNA ribosyltransferase-isomerase